MDFFSSTYAALRGPQGATQTMQDTIDKLSDRLLQSTSLADRRAAVLGLKGLARDAKREVGEASLVPLLGVLERDGEEEEVAKSVMETLVVLCESDEEQQGAAPTNRKARDDLGLRHTDVVLSSPNPIHTLVALLAQTAFYTRFTALQLLAILLQHRTALVQSYVLSAPAGAGALVAVLQERREIIRNEALLLLQNLTSTNADLQKIVAFEGAFERLLDIASQEGGVEGGVVAQDCLMAIDGLLRFNVSNQNYFRETSAIPRLPPLLLFPSPAPSPSEPAPQSFSLQFWDAQKLANAQLVVGLVQVLVGGVGSGKVANQMALLATGMTRCLVELALASNAPTPLKFSALQALTSLLSSSQPSQALLSSLRLTPYAWAGGDEWDKLPAQPALSCLVRLALAGDLGAATTAGGAEVTREGLEVRAAAVRTFESWAGGNASGVDDLVSSMVPAPEGTDSSPFSEPPQPPGTILLTALITLPAPTLVTPAYSGLPGAGFNTYPALFASLLFAHLLRASESSRERARALLPLPPTLPGEDEDDDGPETLVQVLVGNLTLAQREAARARAEGRAREAREWARACVGWLVVLCAWLWESPGTVREFLSEGANLQVLIQPVTQASGVDPLVQGLAAFLLGTCYEFNTEPGEITRATLHPILHSHIGADQFVSRMTRLREDARFKGVAPDAASAVVSPTADPAAGDDEDLPEVEVWFDWAFVEFWKNNYFSVQRAITSDPDSVRPPPGESPQTLALISSLREAIKSQASDLESMQQKLEQLTRERDEERETLAEELDSLEKQVADLSSALSDAHGVAKTKEDEARSVEEELRQKIHQLTEQIAELGAASSAPPAASAPSEDITAELHALSAKVETLSAEVLASQTRARDQEKEQEDLLVLLDELSQKRKKDKARMKEAGMEVSEGEEDEEDEDE